MSVVQQHTQMLVVRKEGKAHHQYNSFRSAFELLEAVGREPQDNFEEMEEDVSPLQRLEKRIQQQMLEMKTKNDSLESQLRLHKLENQHQMSEMKTTLQLLQSKLQKMMQKMSEVKSKNELENPVIDILASLDLAI